MPSSRNRRRAQSQAQLSGRRRNRGGRNHGNATAAPESSQRRGARRPAGDASAANGAAQVAVQTAPEAQAESAPETQNIIRRRNARARTPVEPLQMYPYLRSELTRIGVLTAIIAIALGALTFVLG